MNTQEKILSREELAARLAAHRANGERIIFANGCFDILHVGHSRYLQAARAEGDVLVVAINSDASLHDLKGDGRPILSESARAQLVAALDAVSYVTIFSEPDVIALLTALRPDVHAKGTDYSVDTVPERDTARQLGVSIAIVGDPKDHSTRDLLARLRGLRMGSATAPRFLVIRLGSLGDLVHTIPAVAALRSTFPDAKLDWVVERHWSAVIELITCVNNVIPLERSAAGYLWCIRRLRQTHFDCAIDFQGLYKSALLARFSGAPRRVGRAYRAAREPGAALFYTDGVTPQGRHVAEMSMSLSVRAGAQPGGMAFPMQVSEAAKRDLAAKLALEGIGKYVVLSPGGGWVSKCWPPERYGAVCAELWRRHGIRSVINAGPGEEQLALEVVRTAGGAKPIALTPPLSELAALLAQAQLVVAADTGPLHLAAALGAPVVALFGPTDPARNGPLPRGRVVRVPPSPSGAAEQGDYARGDYIRGDTFSEEMMSLSVEQVLAAVEDELGARA